MIIITNTVKSFDDRVLDILTNFRGGKDLESYVVQNQSLEFTNALKYAIKEGYVEGITLHTSAIGERTLSIPNPQITRKGLKFLESSTY